MAGGFFCVIFATFLFALNPDIQKENRRSHVKMYKFILFYFIKKGEMKQHEYETLC